MRWTSMPLGIPRIAIGAISAARTRLIFPGEPVVTSTNQGSARNVIRVPRTEIELGCDQPADRGLLHRSLSIAVI